MTTCPECDGTGYLMVVGVNEPGRDTLCDVCDGEGEVTSEETQEVDWFAVTQDILERGTL